MGMLLNRCKSTTATTGTGAVAVGTTAVVPYQTWSAAGALAGRYYDYLIEDGNSWEIGTGLYNGTTITRPGPGVDRNFASSTGALLSLTGSATIASVANKNTVSQREYRPPLATDFSTMYASLRAGTTANALVFDNDPDFGMGIVDPSTENGYMKAAGRPIPLANRGVGTTFTITTKLRANTFTVNDQFGLWVRASATQYIFFNLFNRAGSVSIQRAFYNAAWNDGTFTLVWEYTDAWLRIVVSNQTTSYYISRDGFRWTQCYTSENLFTAPFTDYGFCMGRFSTTAKWYITVDYLSSDEFPG